MKHFIILILLIASCKLAHAQEYKLRKAIGSDCWGYHTTDFKYEGDCENGRITGRGVMYSKLPDGHAERAEGEFYEGKLNGYVTICYVNVDRISDGCKYKISEGYWKMDKQHGRYKEYYKNGQLKFDGEWQNGKKHGYGKEYSESGTLIKEGNWSNDNFSGSYAQSSSNNSQGTNAVNTQTKNGYVENFPLISNGRQTYKGYVKNGKPDGLGTSYTLGDKTYEGYWKEGLHHGKGKSYDVNTGRLYYDGEYANHDRHGYGVFYYDDGSIYKGNWENGWPTSGEQMFTNGYKFQGNWLRSDPKYGTQTWPGGDKYVGDMKGHSRHGYGTYFKNGKKFYEGQWVNNVYHGAGKMYNEDGTIYWEGVANNGDLNNGRYVQKSSTNTEKWIGAGAAVLAVGALLYAATQDSKSDSKQSKATSSSSSYPNTTYSSYTNSSSTQSSSGNSSNNNSNYEKIEKCISQLESKLKIDQYYKEQLISGEKRVYKSENRDGSGVTITQNLSRNTWEVSTTFSYSCEKKTLRETLRCYCEKAYR